MHMQEVDSCICIQLTSLVDAWGIIITIWEGNS